MEHVFEDIDGRYGIGKFGPFEVYIDTQRGMFNGSKLARGCGKEYSHWRENAGTGAFIQVLSDRTGLDESELLYTRKGGRNEERTRTNGTYMHPHLVIHLAQWCSPEYHLDTIEVIKDYHDREAKQEMKALKKDNGKLVKKVSKLDRLIETLRLEAKEREQRAIARSVRADTKMDAMHDEIHEVKTELCGTKHKLGLAKRDRVVGTGKPEHEGRFILWALNPYRIDDEAYQDPNEVLYQYDTSRITAQSRASCIANKLIDYPDAEILLELTGTPSAMDLWRRYADKHGRKLERYRFKFNLREGYTQEMLIRDIKKAHSERLTNKGLR